VWPAVPGTNPVSGTASAPHPCPAWAGDASLKRSQQAAGAPGRWSLSGCWQSVPKQSGQMWLGDTASPAPSDSKLPRAEQLLNLDFPSALSGTCLSGSPAERRACRRAACCAPAAEGTAEAGCLLQGEGPCCAESHAPWGRYHGVLVLCQRTYQLTALLGDAQGSPGCLCCCEKAELLPWPWLMFVMMMFVPEKRACWVLLSVFRAALHSPVLL